MVVRRWGGGGSGEGSNSQCGDGRAGEMVVGGGQRRSDKITLLTNIKIADYSLILVLNFNCYQSL